MRKKKGKDAGQTGTETVFEATARCGSHQFHG